MKKEILKRATESTKALIKNSPIEAAIILAAYLIARFSDKIIYQLEGLLLFPLFLFGAMILNRCCTGKVRLLYYASIATVPLMLFDGYTELFGTRLLGIYTAVFITLVLGRSKGNDTTFAGSLFGILKAGIVSGFIAYSAATLLLMILASTDYFFDIHLGEAITRNILTLSSFLLWPAMFVAACGKEGGQPGRIMQTLLLKVSVPAILIYAAILYIYFAKIAIAWELPKGGIVYLSITFIATTLLAATQYKISNSKCYDWFFNHLPLFVLPAPIMFWVSIIYRIHEYGLTESRIIIVVAGLAITAILATLAIGDREKRLHRTAIAVAIIFGTTLLLPAQEISILSQNNRAHKIANALGLTDGQGNINTSKIAPLSNYTQDEIEMLRELQSALTFLGRGDEITALPNCKNIPTEIYVTPQFPKTGIKIPAQFTTYNQTLNTRITNEGKTILVNGQKHEINYNDICKQLIERTGKTVNDQFIKELKDEAYNDLLYYYQTEEYFLVIKSIDFHVSGNNLSIGYLSLDAIFTK